MNLPFKIAWRYFKSRSPLALLKAPNAINLLTLISLFAVIVITAATILLLSVLNGLMSLVGDLNDQVNPEIKVLPIQGKVFKLNSEQYEKLNGLNGVEAYTKVLEETALLQYADNQIVATVKGVDKNFEKVNRVQDNLIRGYFRLTDSLGSNAIVGLGIAQQLSLSIKNPFDKLLIVIPKRSQRVSFNPAGLIGQIAVTPVAEYAIQKDVDDKYVFVPIEALRPLLNYAEEISALEFKLKKGSNTKVVQKEIAAIVGENMEVLNRAQQNKSWYKVMQFEKWVSFALLILIMAIASFNLISSISMMVMDKRKDISTLKALGLTSLNVGAVFRNLGFLIGLIGAVFGALLAIALVFVQRQFGIIPMEGSFVVESYPIKLQWFDVLLTIGSIVLISWLASLPPSRQAEKQALDFGE